MKKGFTLVELSIVLVIIGLLIGGILVGQSMISTAKTQNIIQNIQQFDAAVYNFQASFNTFPGDNVSLGCTNNLNGGTCADGRVTDIYNTSYYWDSEIANFWVQLQKGGFTYQNLTFTATRDPAGLSTPATTTTPNTPLIKADINSTIVGLSCPLSKSGNCWLMSDRTGNTGGQYWSQGHAVFKPVTAAAMDTKIDDGRPYTGVTQHYAGHASAEYGGYAENVPFGASCTSSNKYSTSNTNVNCFLTVGMLNQ